MKLDLGDPVNLLDAGKLEFLYASYRRERFFSWPRSESDIVENSLWNSIRGEFATLLKFRLQEIPE